MSYNDNDKCNRFEELALSQFEKLDKQITARESPGEHRELSLHVLYRTGRDRLQSYRGLERLQERGAVPPP